MNTDQELKVTNQGQALILNWQRAENELKTKKQQLENAEFNVQDAKFKLFKWLIPKNAQVGATYCVPWQTTFIDVRVFANGFHEIKIRN